MALNIPLVGGGNPTNSSGYNTYNLGVHDNNPYAKMADESAKHAARISSKINNDVAYKTRIYNDPTYERYGVIPNTYNTEEELNKARAKNQLGWEQFGNFLVQAVGSEIALGTLRGFSDIADAAINLFNEKNDYTNPLSSALEEAQDNLKKQFEIYRENPNASFDMTDSGWWWDNMVSTATTVSLLLPSLGTTKGLSLLGKGIKAAGTIERVNNAGKTVQELNKFGRFTNKMLNTGKEFASGLTGIERGSTYARAAKEASKHGMNALFSRTAENYQEAREIYKNYYSQYLDRINNMSDKDKAEFIARHPEYEGMSNADIANDIAEQGARETFIQDYWMLGMDFLQFRALSGIWKGNFNVASTAGTRIAQRNALAALTKDGKQIEDSFVNRGKEYFKNIFNHPTQSLLFTELGEGFEEGFQGIQQERGHEVGERILDPRYKTKTLGDYLTDASIYEQAFWGVVGGIAFGGSAQLLGSTMDAYNRHQLEKNHKEGKIDDDAYNRLKMTYEQQRIAEINGRKNNIDALLQNMKTINEGKNPYKYKENSTLDENGNSTREYEDIQSEEEKDMLKGQAINSFITNLTMLAANNGNYDSLKEYINSSELNQYFMESDRQGYIADMNFNNKLVEKMDDVYQAYSSTYSALVNDVRADNERAMELTAMEITRNKLNLKDLNDDIDRLNREILKNEDNSLISDNYKKIQWYNRVKERLDLYDEVHNRLLADKNNGVITQEKYNESVDNLNKLRRDTLARYQQQKAAFNIIDEDILKSDKDVNDYISQFNKFMQDNKGMFDAASDINNQIVSRQTHRNTPNANIQKLINSLIDKEIDRDLLEDSIPQTKDDYYKAYERQIKYIKLNNEFIQKGANNVVKKYIKDNIGYDAAINNILNETAPEDIMGAIDIIKSIAVDENTSLNDILQDIKKSIIDEDNKNKKQRTQTSVNGIAQTETEETDNNQPPVEEQDDESGSFFTGGTPQSNVNPHDNIGQELFNPVNGKMISPISVVTKFGEEGYMYLDENGKEQFVSINNMKAAEEFVYNVGEEVKLNNNKTATITMITSDNVMYNTEDEEDIVDTQEEFLDKVSEEVTDDLNIEPEEEQLNLTEDEKRQQAIYETYINTLGITTNIRDNSLIAFKTIAEENGITKQELVNNVDNIDYKNNLFDNIYNRTMELLNDDAEIAAMDIDVSVVKDMISSLINAIFNESRNAVENIVAAPIIEAPFSTTGTVDINKDNIRNAIRDFIEQYFIDTDRKFKRDKVNKVDIREIFRYMIEAKINPNIVNLIMNNINDYKDSIPNVKFMYMKYINSILSNPNKFLNEYKLKVEGENIGIEDIRFNAPTYTHYNDESRNVLAQKLAKAIEMNVPIKIDYNPYITNINTGKAIGDKVYNELNDYDAIVLYSGNDKREYTEYGIIVPVNASPDGTEFYLRKLKKGISFIVSKDENGNYKSNYDDFFYNLIRIDNDNTDDFIMNDYIDLNKYVADGSREKVIEAYTDLVNILDDIRIMLSNGYDVKKDNIIRTRILNNDVIKAMRGQKIIKHRENKVDDKGNITENNEVKAIIDTAIQFSKILYYNKDSVDNDDFSAEDASIDSYTNWIEKLYINYTQTYQLEKDIIKAREEGKTLLANVKVKNGARPIITENNGVRVLHDLNDKDLRFMETQPETYYVDANGNIRTDRGNIYNSDDIITSVTTHNMGFVIGMDNGRPLLAMFNNMNPIKGSGIEKAVRDEIKYLLKGYLNGSIGHDEFINKSRNLFCSITSDADTGIVSNESLLYGLEVVSNAERVFIRPRNGKDILVRLERYDTKNKESERRAFMAPITIKGKDTFIRKRKLNDKELDNIVEDLINRLTFNKSNFVILNNDKDNTESDNHYIFKKDGKLIIKFSNGLTRTYNNYAHYAVANNIAQTTQSVDDKGNYVENDVALNNIYVTPAKVADLTNVETIFGKNTEGKNTERVINTADILSYFGIDPIVIDKLLNYKINGEEALIPSYAFYINDYYRDNTNKEDKDVDASYDVERDVIKIYKSGKQKMLGSSATAKRLLIHESLHRKIRESNDFYKKVDDLIDIYHYTKNRLNKVIAELKDSKDERLIEKYNAYIAIKEQIFDKLDKRYPEDKYKQTLAEEFLVESLSQGELTSFLANQEYDGDIKISDEENKTLLQKILEFICDIFGINRRENSILAKEFEVLGNNDKVEQYEKIVDSSEKENNIETTEVIDNEEDEEYISSDDEEIDEENYESIDDEEEYLEDDDYELESATGTVSDYVSEPMYDNSNELQIEHLNNNSAVNSTGIMSINDMNDFIKAFPYNERANMADMLDNGQLSYACK